MKRQETRVKTFNPEMMMIARKARGMSQSDLAKLLHMKQSHISKIEAGFQNPPDEMIAKLPDVLGYQEEFFFRHDQIFGIESATIYHRMRQSVGAKVLGTIEAQVNIYRMHVSRLLQAVDTADCKLHSYDIEEYGSIEDIASAVRSEWVLPSGPIKNLVRTIENAGGIVIPYDFGTKQIDGLSQWIANLPPMFFINSKLSGDRFRFSLAHELGHLLLHRIPQPEMEKEAHAFASAFLMPARDIFPSLQSLALGKLGDLKAYWRVSMAALVYRAATLKAIDAQKIQRLRIQLAPYRLREPVDIDVEQPTILSEIIEVYLKDLGYSVPELCKLLSIQEEEFSILYNSKLRHLTIVN